MTEKLYDLDSYIADFDAEIVSCREVSSSVFKNIITSACNKGAGNDSKRSFYELILDRTAFFPEGGGQASDTGFIKICAAPDAVGAFDLDDGAAGVGAACADAGRVDPVCVDASCVDPACTDTADADDTGTDIEVIDVRIINDEIVHLIASGHKPDPGTKVSGRIDRLKRYDRMQQHSGEHLLSGTVHKYFGFDNTGFHLSDVVTTVDFNGTFSDEDIFFIEDTVNDIIIKNVACRIYYPEKDELDKLNYRSKKELKGPVRIVDFSGFDICACCAPHVRSTIEIGLFKILGYEHFKGGTRMTIGCGRRLLADYRQLQSNNRLISRLLSVKPLQTADGVEKLYDSYKNLKFDNIRLEKEMLELKVKLTDEPVLFLETADTGNARYAVNALAERFDGYCGVFTGNDEKGYTFIITCRKELTSDPDSGLNCSTLLQDMKIELKASGGGSAAMIQGSVSMARPSILDFLKRF